jgi:hypothetical protein
MIEFNPGQFIELGVAERIEDSGRNYLRLTDGYRETYRVPAYDFQIEWEESLVPNTINCYVKKVNEKGLPLLEQSKRELMESLYTDNDFYPFKVLSKNEDANTNATYYALKDPFGIYHRFYVNEIDPNKEVSDIFSLWVGGIVDKGYNNVFLKLKYVEDETQENTQKVSTSSEDPRTESKFGFETDTIEFKSSIVYPAGNIDPDIDQQIKIITKTIAGFQNANGGKLYIGVNDSGDVVGIEHDFQHLNSSEVDNYTYPLNIDGYQNKLRVSIKNLLGNISNSKVRIDFDSNDGKTYCIVDVKPCDYPIFMQSIKLFQRAGNMTQLLRDEEITYFIESKWRERNYFITSNFDNTTISEPEDVQAEESETVLVEQDSKEKANEINISNEPLVKTDEDIWKHINLFENGDWSFSKNTLDDDEILQSIPVYKSQKKSNLIMAYDNGRVNVVSIHDLISPKGKNGRRKMRPALKRYKTGWFTDATLTHVFVASPYDLLAFKATTKDGTEWFKMHRVADISVHDINAKGNVLINERLDDAEINFCEFVPQEYYHLVSGLVLKSSQTSSSLGYRVNDKDLKKTIQALFKILEKISGISQS